MSILWFAILVGVLITVHELGHLLAARLLDIGVLKLSIGFGPRIAAFKKGETEYAVALIPLGGYVRLLGEEDASEVPAAQRHRAYSLRPAWQRLVVLLGGPLANLIFPVLVFTHLYARQPTARAAVIGTVLAGQPAQQAGLRPGDRVVAIDGEAVRTWDEMNQRIGAAAGRALKIAVERSGVSLTKYITPRAHRRYDALGLSETVGLIGVAPHYRLPLVGVIEDGPAHRAGLRTFDRVLAINGRPVENADDLEPLERPRSGAMLLVSYLRPRPSALGFAHVARLEPRTAEVVPSRGAEGFDAGVLPADLFVRAVEPGTPAASIGGVGLRPGDVLLALDGARLSSWDQLVQKLEEEPGEPHRLVWRGRDAEHSAGFTLLLRRQLDEYHTEETRFVFGADGAHAIRPVDEVPLERHVLGAAALALRRAFHLTWTLGRALGLTLLGRLPSSSLGGPILIYEAAGVAAQHGPQHFLVMAALISLNIGLLNLLPVPLLDGGQATMVLIERVRRRPLSARARARAGWVGLMIVFAVWLLVFHNDLVRYLMR
jgi:regulator of sigma E protease